jgi:cysteine synthase
MLAHDALDAIGRTPLVRLRKFEPEGGAEIWLKLDGGNPTGSYKDRMAASVLGRALERGDVQPGDRVVEYIRAIDQERAFEMCRRLASEAGSFGGGSTGRNVVTTIELSREIGRGKRIVTLGCDNGTKYLGGHIYRRP